MSRHLFTADLHLGHDLVAKTRGFDSTARHDFEVIESLRDSVRHQDTLWILGDYSVSKHRYARELLEWLPCRKILIPGNHDPEHPMGRGAWKAQREALEIFTAVLPYQRIRLAKKDFMMSHLPYLGGGDHVDTERHPEYRLPDFGMPLLCGHVHGAWRSHGNQLNVGLDVNNLKPVTDEEVLDWHRQRGF